MYLVMYGTIMHPAALLSSVDHLATKVNKRQLFFM